MSVDLGRNAY